MKVIKVISNWYYSHDVGVNYKVFKTAHENVLSIEYHEPQGEGDKHYVDVTYKDGIVTRVFNLHEIDFEQ